MKFFLISILVVGGLVFFGLYYAVVANEYACEGVTKVAQGPSEADHGKLRIENYAFWVALWNATSDGNATFQSTKFSFYEGELLLVGYGNLAFYMAPSSKEWFSFKRATYELEIDDGRMSFFGHCIAVL